MFKTKTKNKILSVFVILTSIIKSFNWCGKEKGEHNCTIIEYSNPILILINFTVPQEAFSSSESSENPIIFYFCFTVTWRLPHLSPET